MRTSLFVPALFAASLITGAALADKPHGAVERIRARGDVIDKNYRGTERLAGRAAPQQNVGAPAQYSRSFTGGQNRVSCSDTGMDCPSHRGTTSSVEARGTGASASHARVPAVLEKAMGGDRTSFNEAGESNGVSARAAKRAWSHAAPSAGGAHAALTPDAAKRMTGADNQSKDTRVSCNEGDQCGASSKAVKKQWAYQAVKAGTWKGPEAPQVTPAARRIDEMKKQKSAPESNVVRRERTKQGHESHN